MDKLPSANISPELTLVIPTYNEADNIKPLIDHLIKALNTIDWEVIFVDDNSPDNTANIIRSHAQKNQRIRCLQRLNRRGLSSACIEEFLASHAPYVAVMDADLQHNEYLMPDMLAAVKDHG